MRLIMNNSSSRPQLSFIVAMTKDRVIGKNNTMPWHLPADFAWFKENTIGKPIVMGRKTFESIGRPLPNRTNIVLSRKPFIHDNVLWANNLEKAIQLAKNAEEIMIIGGGEIFKQYFDEIDRLYLTEIQASIDGDTFFPNFNLSDWEIKKDLFHHKDAKNPYDLRFLILDRIR